jgi:ABC-type transport system involved in multi-copper enzyme maturation permease subunit
MSHPSTGIRSPEAFEICRFELAYQAGRLVTWIYFCGLFAFGVLIMRSFSPEEGTFANTPSLVAFFSVMGGIIWQFLAASVAGDAAARDLETRMHPLVYTTPITKAGYLGGRFAAALTLNIALLFALHAGILLSLLLPRSDPEVMGPWRPAGHLTAFFVIALPHAFIVTVFQFAAALRQRRALAAYIASVLLFVTALIVGTTLAQAFREETIAKLFDFIGPVNVMIELERMTPLERNTRLVALGRMFLANRVVWVGIALAAMALTFRRFEFAHPATREWRLPFTRRRTQPTPDASEHRESQAITVPPLQGTFGFATCALQTLALAWTSFRTIARSRIGLTLVGIMALGSAFFSTEWFLFLEQIPLLPRTDEVLLFYTPGLGYRTIWVIVPLLIVFHAGELIWQERDEGVSEIFDTSPVPEWSLFLGKFLGLGLVIGVWMAFFMAAAMLVQVYLGYPQFDFGLYLKALFGFQFADYLLFALLVLVVHAVVNQKYLGYGVALTAYGCIAFAGTLGIEHKLLIYASDTGWSYSPMRGFGPSVGPWLWFKLYWAAWAVLLAVTARLFLVRGKETSPAIRLRIARQRFTRATVGVAAAAMALAVAVGGFIYYNTNVLNAYRPAEAMAERLAEYERRYRQYDGLPQPRLTATNLRVEIFPARRVVEIRGSYRLVNEHATAIGAIHVAERWGLDTVIVGLDRPATRTVEDRDFGHHVFTLERPLAPGESVRLDFEVHRRPRGFGITGIDPSVVANGTFFQNDWLPAVGYQPQRELSNASDRRLHGLPPRRRIPSLEDNRAARDRVDGGPIDFDAVLGIDEDQTALAPGTLRRTWTESGRRYFHYATDVPIGNQYRIFAARYALREAQWTSDSGQKATIQIFHHPGHTVHLDRMVRSTQSALSYYSRHFGPYPFGHVRIVEHPGAGKGMHADANTIDYQEGFSLLNPRPDRDVDLPYHIVAHEVAHQWWGSQLAPAYVEGAGVLVESLATYSAMLAGHDSLGDDHLRRYLRFVRHEYQNPRSPAMPPLLRAVDGFLNYRKGPLALYALGEYIGQDRVRAALRSLLEKHGPRQGQVTSLDLYRELQSVTPESSRWLLHDLFEKNTFWDLETAAARAEPAATGAWQVTLDVEARKRVIDEAGVETVLPMDDWIEIGVFAGDERVYLQKHRIHAGKQRITLTVPSRPTLAGIDARYLLVDWVTADNVRTVTVKD